MDYRTDEDNKSIAIVRVLNSPVDPAAQHLNLLEFPHQKAQLEKAKYEICARQSLRL